MPVAPEITCAICGWEGRSVGEHAVKVHGLNAREYQRLTGGPTISDEGAFGFRATYSDLFGEPHWNQARIIAAMQAWAKRRGRSPSYNDWQRARHSPAKTRPGEVHYRPSTQTVREHFGSWSAALEAAGLESNPSSPFMPHCRQGHPRTPENTRTDPRTGTRTCRVCNTEYARKRRQRNIAAGLNSNGTERKPRPRPPRAKLTDAEVREIRALAGTVRQVDLASQFGVTQGAISKVIRGETYRGIA